MRFLLFFFIGFLSFFYISEIIQRLISTFRYSLLGLGFILVGFLVGFFGSSFLEGGLNVLTASFFIGSGLGVISHHLLSKKFILFKNFEKEFVLRHETKFERFLEILPGALTWLALTSPIWLSFTLPYAVAYLILIADVYWLLSALRISILILIGYKKMEYAKKQNWLNLLKTGFPKDFKKYYHLILIPTYKEALYILTPTFNAITTSDYPKDKIFLAIGFEQRDDPKKIRQTLKHLKKIEGKVAGIFTTIHPYNLTGEVAGQGSNT